MKVAIKTLKGDLFHVEAELSDTVTILKEKIQADKPDFQVDKQKLIHAGKVLKDSQTISDIGMKETDFIVCMVSKEAAKPKPVAESVPAQSIPPPSASAPVPRPVAAPVPVPTPAPVVPIQSVATPAAIESLTALGFPQSECRAALEAANGIPDLAYEYLLSGIPEQALARQARPAAVPTSLPSQTPPAATGNAALQQFRNHPQFEALKQLVQSNPASLPQVLNLIGQQNPELLDAIHANNDEFLAMMNEPINANPTPAPAPAPAAPSPFGSGLGGAGEGPNPMQIVALLSALPPEQRAAFAQQVGLSPEQLNAFMQMVSSMPPEQLQQMLPGMGGGGGGAGGHVIQLTEEEHAAVTRLTQLGFSQQQAVQAYLACDKNEALAANLLFDGGFGFDDDDGGMGGGYGDYGDDDN